MAWDDKAEAAARDALRTIVRDPKYGVAALSDGKVMMNLLLDHLPPSRERSLLVAAAEVRVADTLRDHVSRGTDPAAAIRLAASSFASNPPFALDRRIWVTTEIAEALGLAGASTPASEWAAKSARAALPSDNETAARAALAVIVTQYGAAALSDGEKMTELLRDRLPPSGEQSLLIAAADAGLAETLREDVAQGMDAARAMRLAASSLASSTPFTLESCDWVIIELAVALGIVPVSESAGLAAEEPVAPVSSESPEPDPPVATDHVEGDALAGHVFISYARGDSAAVEPLHQRLEQAGIAVWRDTAKLLPGQDWRTEIRRAIENGSIIFMACFSLASTSRRQSYQNEELTLAIEQVRQRRPDIPWLIPIRLDDCEIPSRDIGGGRTLASIQRADLFGARRDDELERLVVAVKGMLADEPGELGPAAEPYSPWPERWLDASDIDTLNHREAARRLTLMRPDDAVKALAGASVRAAADVLEVLLLEDHEALAVTLLAHGRRSKARDLIAAMAVADEWLQHLPAAANAIDLCERAHESMLGQNVGPLSHLGPFRQGTHGFRKPYEHGQVLWSPHGDAHVITGEIGEYYQESCGGSSGWLGFPTSDEAGSPGLNIQFFEHGVVTIKDGALAEVWLRPGAGTT